MNSVANQTVATMMNSNFSALKSNANPGKTSNDFSQVFKKINNSNRQQNLQPSEQDVETTEPKSHGNDKLNKALVSENTTAEKAVSKKVKEVTGEIQGEVTEVKAVMSDEDMEELYTQAMNAVSEMFQVPIEDLQTALEAKDMTLLDLSDGTNLIDLVQSIYGHDDMATMLLDSDATQTLKDVHDEVQTLVANLDESFDMTSFKEQLAAAAANGPTQAVQEEPQAIGQIIDPIISQEGEMTTTNGPGMEVNDLREAGQETTKYKQSESNGQEQNNQTFGELMSDNINNLKEVVGLDKSNQPEFQQISTREVIDQIVTKAIVTLSNEKTTMQLQLNPGHLGKVAVSVTAEQGLIKGQFIAENTVVKEMLETNMIQLKTQLEEQGIKVDKIEVALGNANQYFDQRQEGNKDQEQTNKPRSHKVGRIKHLMEVDEMETIEPLAAQATPNFGEDAYTVEYSA